MKLTLSSDIGSDKWKSQIRAAFADCRNIKQANAMYKRLYRFYSNKLNVVGKPDERWLSAYWTISDAHKDVLRNVKL